MSEEQNEVTIETKEPEQIEKFYDAFGLRYEDVTVRKGSARETQIRIQEFSIEHIGELTKVISVLMDMLGGGFKPAALAQSGELGIKLLRLSTGLEEKDFHRIGMADTIELFATLIKVNESFFAQIPRLGELGTGLIVAVAR